MIVNMYKVYEQEQREAAYADYVGAPEFKALTLEAEKRGYRHAKIGEINASANRASFALDLYCWRGGLWAKCSALAKAGK